MVKNGHKCPKIQFSGNWWENRVVIAWSSSLSVDIIATAPSDKIFDNESGGGNEGSTMSRHKWFKNSQKCLKIEFSGKWREHWGNWVIVAKGCSLCTDIIATAPSENTFVNTSSNGAKSLLIGKQKW